MKNSSKKSARSARIRMLSFVLTLCMLMSILPAPSLAAGTSNVDQTIEVAANEASASATLAASSANSSSNSSARTSSGIAGSTTANAASGEYKYYPACSSSYTSIVDALNSIGVDSSYSNRKIIAGVNGISDYTGTSFQNCVMLQLLKQGMLVQYRLSFSATSFSLTAGSSSTLNIIFKGDGIYYLNCSISQSGSIVSATWGTPNWTNGTVNLALKGVSAGSATITISLRDRNDTTLLSRSFIVTVTGSGYYINPSTSQVSMTVGNSYDLSFSFGGSNVSYVNINYDGDYVSTSWKSVQYNGSTGTAVISIGGIKEGTTTPKLQILDSSENVLAEKSITVTINPKPAEVVVSSISLNATSMSLIAGNTGKLTATINPSNATNKSVTWSSSNTSVATVSGGTVTAKAAGKATITARSVNGKTATCTVTVTKKTNNIVIGGKDIGYASGSYFTKNGKSCKTNTHYSNKTCHHHGICTDATSKYCNCLRRVKINGKTVDLKASQCFGFARYCEYVVWGTHDSLSPKKFKNLTGTLKSSKCTTATLKAKLLGCSAATHIRLGTGSGSHSISVVSTSSSGITYAECNYDGGCRIRTVYKTWSQFSTYVKGRGGIVYAKAYIK